MKSTKFVLPLIGLIYLASVLPSLAVAGPNPTKVEIRQQNRQERGELRGTIVQNRVQNRFRFLTEAKVKVFEKVYVHLKESLKHGLQVRLQQKTKIEARIATRESEGKNMTTAKTKLGEFTAIQTAYNSAMTALEAKYQEIVAADAKPFTQMKELRTAAQKVRQELTNMRHLLTEVIKLIIKA